MREWLKVTFNITIPAAANKLICELIDNGHTAYVVGGCVRDSLLGRTPNDWDICTSATPEEMLKIFSDYKVIETGLKHGTLTVVVNDQQYEITTFRIDGEYSDNRRPDSVTFTIKLEEDLSRRDFTINAMAYNYDEGLVDPFGGLVDIERRVIRCVGNAEERFDEDALRVLRTFRFACQLGFSIDFTTSMAAQTKSVLLKNISKERINSELCKMIATDYFPNIMLLYPAVWPQIIPETQYMIGFDQANPYHDYDVWQHTSAALRYAASEDITTKLAIFFHDFGKPHCYQEDADGTRHFKGHGKVSAQLADEIMLRLRFDNKTRHDVTELVHYHDAAFELGTKYVKRWLSKIGVEQFKRLLAIRRADIMGQSILNRDARLRKIKDIEQLLSNVLTSAECFSLKDLDISGTDLLQLGFKSDKKLGQTLEHLLQQVIDGELQNNKGELVNAALLELWNYNTEVIMRESCGIQAHKT